MIMDLASCRFRVLAGHFQAMYPILNIDVEAELQQLRVKYSVTLYYLL